MLLRKKEIDAICCLLRTEGNNDTLNIGGTWGSGKTYVSQRVEETLNVEDKKYLVLRINMADYDYCNDPLIPFYISILDYINEDKNATEIGNNKKKLLELVARGITTFQVLSTLIDQTGVLNNLLSLLKRRFEERDQTSDKNNAQEPITNQVAKGLENIRAYREAINCTKEIVDTLCKDAFKKIIFFVDDFDRSIPAFAFRVLNIIHQLKHATKKLQICTIMNREQFERQLQTMYGDLSTACDEHYLTKYIDLEAIIETPAKDKNNISNLLNELGIKHDKHSGYLYLFISCISVRECIRFGKIYERCNIKDFDNSHSGFITRATDPYAAYSLVLLIVLYIRFEMQFRSWWFGLLNNSGIDALTNSVSGFLKNLSENLDTSDNGWIQANKKSILEPIEQLIKNKLFNRDAAKTYLKSKPTTSTILNFLIEFYKDEIILSNM